MQIHGPEFVEESHHQPGGNAETAAQGDSQMGEVAADPHPPFLHFPGGEESLAAEGLVAHVGSEPGLDRLHLVVARPESGGDRPCQLTEVLGLAVTAGQQRTEHRIGQVLNLHEGRPGTTVHDVGRHHLGDGVHREAAGRGHQPLAEIAVDIGELEHGNARRQPVFLLRDPLLGATAGAEHEDEGRRHGDLEGQITGGTQPHGTWVFSGAGCRQPCSPPAWRPTVG